MNIFKHVLILLLFMSIGLFVGCGKKNKPTVPTPDPDTPKEGSRNLYVHYYRFDNNYTPWDIWLWENLPTSGDGKAYSFEKDETSTDFNYGGVVSKINLGDKLEDATQLGIIIRKGGDSWTDKDATASDRFITLPSSFTEGDYHVYFVQGDTKIGTSPMDANGPSKMQKFTSADFVGDKKISFSATCTLLDGDVSVLENGVAIEGIQTKITGNTGTIELPNSLDFSSKYSVSALFPDGSNNSLEISFNGIYSTAFFNEAYGYDGALGAIIDEDTTTFRVWSPFSDNIKLNLYTTGTPEALGGSNEKTTYEMIKGEKGTWYYTVNSNLHNTYYTYTVCNKDTTKEVVDPYAKSTGVNGLRGLVVDFSNINSEIGFEYNKRADSVSKYTDAIIYELHVRDLTTSTTWKGDASKRGKFLGLIQTGTTYQGVSTGFDHIQELGVTSVQLLPIFDFPLVDETKVGQVNYDAFNWGYMPLNYNSLEGSYSSDPYDGLTRIKEFKEVTMAYNDVGIRINMDVVYNHTAFTGLESNFDVLVPGYYYRMNENGTYSNGSGCGNETASERYMMHKFIVDSVLFWAEEYNLGGFRFDLMSVHDYKTMNEVAEKLHDIDPSIMVYGEPWTGGTSMVSASVQASKDNFAKMPMVAAFNDDIRDGIKGSVFDEKGKGWVQGSTGLTNTSKVKYGLTGGVKLDGIYASLLSSNDWAKSPNKTINYVACHDNNTIYDKIVLSTSVTQEEKIEMVKQAYSLVLLSEGITFIHAGDEFLRQKVNSDGSLNHNSYNSGDKVNQIDWSKKVENIRVNNYIKDLIQLRKDHSSFHLSTSEEVTNSFAFLETEEGIIAYEITGAEAGIQAMLVIHNSTTAQELTLPAGNWTILLNQNGLSASKQVVSNKIQLGVNESVVLYQE